MKYMLIILEKNIEQILRKFSWIWNEIKDFIGKDFCPEVITNIYISTKTNFFKDAIKTQNGVH